MGDTERIELRDCTVDTTQRLVQRPGVAVVVLSEHEHGLLCYLAARPGQAVSRDELLREVWGYRPGLQTRAVDNTMMRLRAKVEASPTSPEHLLTVRGVGYRFEPLVSPAASSAPDTPAEGALVGRAGELAALGGLLASGARLVTVQGPGGVGKTALARAALARQGEGVFIELVGTDSPEGVAEAVLVALGRSPGTEPVQAAATALSQQRGLVVLDNAEEAAGSAAAHVGVWLGVLPPGTALLVTSRVRLGLRAEQVLSLAPLAAADAEALFVARLPPGTTVGAEARQPLLQWLEGLPLAVELAAAWMDVVSPAQLLARMQAQLRVLAARERDRHPRHRSLVAAFAASWELLDDAERDVLERCAVFAGGFTLEAAEAVLPALPAGRWPLEVLARLHDASLLTVATSADAEADAPMRYRMLETVRGYALERLSPPAREQTERALAAHLIGWAAGRSAAALRREQANIDAAVDRACAHAPTLAAELFVCCHQMTWSFASPDRTLTRIGRLQAAAGAAEPLLAARLHQNEARWRTRLGRYREAFDVLGESLALIAAEPGAEAATLRGMLCRQRGFYLIQAGALEEARPWLERALEIAQQGEDGALRMYAHLQLADLETRLGEHASADRHIIAAAGCVGAGALQAEVLRRRSVLRADQGALEASLEALAQAAAHDAPGSFGWAITAVLRAGVLLILGRDAETRQALDACAEIFQDRDVIGTARVLFLRAALRWQRGELDEAEASFAEVAALCEDSDHDPATLRVRAARTALAWERGVQPAPTLPADPDGRLEAGEREVWQLFAQLPALHTAEEHAALQAAAEAALQQAPRTATRFAVALLVRRIRARTPGQLITLRR